MNGAMAWPTIMTAASASRTTTIGTIHQALFWRANPNKFLNSNSKCLKNCIELVFYTPNVLIKYEILAPVLLIGQRWLLLLVEQAGAEQQEVHFRAHETAVGVLRSANNRLATNIEGCVDQNSVTGFPLERLQQFVETRVALRIHGLHTRRHVHVGDRGNGGSHDIGPFAQIGSFMIRCSSSDKGQRNSPITRW